MVSGNSCPVLQHATVLQIVGTQYIRGYSGEYYTNICLYKYIRPSYEKMLPRIKINEMVCVDNSSNICNVFLLLVSVVAFNPFTGRLWIPSNYLNADLKIELLDKSPPEKVKPVELQRSEPCPRALHPSQWYQEQRVFLIARSSVPLAYQHSAVSVHSSSSSSSSSRSPLPFC